MNQFNPFSPAPQFPPGQPAQSPPPVQGFGPHPTAPVPAAAPGQFPQAQGYAPPPAQYPPGYGQQPAQYGGPPGAPAGDPYDQMGQASALSRNPPVPHGVHVLEFVRMRESNGYRGRFGILEFTCANSNNPSAVGGTFGMLFNKGKNGTPAEFASYLGKLKAVLLPVLGHAIGSPAARELDTTPGAWGRIVDQALNGPSSKYGPLEGGRKLLVNCFGSPGKPIPNKPGEFYTDYSWAPYVQAAGQ